MKKVFFSMAIAVLTLTSNLVYAGDAAIANPAEVAQQVLKHADAAQEATQRLTDEEDQATAQQHVDNTRQAAKQLAGMEKESKKAE